MQLKFIYFYEKSAIKIYIIYMQIDFVFKDRNTISNCRNSETVTQ